MAASHNFRSSLNGFNREDVVRYIEYINAKHAAKVNQLTSEAAQLREKLENQPAVPDHSEWEQKYNDQVVLTESQAESAEASLEALRQQLAQVLSQNTMLSEELNQCRENNLSLKNELDALKKEHAAQDLSKQELEAYRRAERAERSARERAEQIYQQATGTLAQATTQVDTAASHIDGIVSQVKSCLSELQSAVEESKNSLSDAAATMAAIRPGEAEE